jgi:hypothetical protein
MRALLTIILLFILAIIGTATAGADTAHHAQCKRKLAQLVAQCTALRNKTSNELFWGCVATGMSGGNDPFEFYVDYAFGESGLYCRHPADREMYYWQQHLKRRGWQ